eukprot:GHVP01021533.1.p1 GENE.GHVP01021533.1~~GHVP01021533.1.p1  ORF type:complete len:601 (-),score=121.43 GHVP01021533.1:902-2704(-)
MAGRQLLRKLKKQDEKVAKEKELVESEESSDDKNIQKSPFYRHLNDLDSSDDEASSDSSSSDSSFDEVLAGFAPKSVEPQVAKKQTDAGDDEFDFDKLKSDGSVRISSEEEKEEPKSPLSNPLLIRYNRFHMSIYNNKKTNRPKQSLSKFYFANAQKSYPRFVDSERFDCVQNTPSCDEYALEENADSWDGSTYCAILLSGDLEGLHMYNSKQPFHIDSCIRLAEYYRSQHNYEKATEFINRALYSITLKSDPDFHPDSKMVVCDPDVKGNIVLYKLLFLELTACMKRNDKFRALEVGKLLVMFDPWGDCCNCLTILDSLYLKTNLLEEFLALDDIFVSLLRKLVASKPSKPLSLLRRPLTITDNVDFKPSDEFPNFAFSRAVALKMLGRDEEADDQLERSLCKFPAFLRIFYTALKRRRTLTTTEIDVPWDICLGHPDFASADPYENKGLSALIEKLLDIHISSSELVWDNHVDWVHGVISKIVSMETPPLLRTKDLLNLSENSFNISLYWKMVKAEYFGEDIVFPYKLRMDRWTRCAFSDHAYREGNVSLQSDPIVIFLQLLLPWNFIDTSGMSLEAKDFDQAPVRQKVFGHFYFGLH